MPRVRPAPTLELPDAGRRAAAWAVHAFTTSGVVLGFLAMLAVFEGDVRKAFLWLGLALLVDGVDGTLARRVRVREWTPQVDGATLDNVIDFFNYVAVPALMVWWFGLVPAGWETPAAAAMLAVSCYTFANSDMKTQDLWFSGFPALWNLVVLYVFILELAPWTTLALIAACCLLTFAPFKYVHPLRVRAWRGVTVPMTALWSVMTLLLVLGDPAEGQARILEPALFWLWVGASLYFIALSVWRTLRGAPG